MRYIFGFIVIMTLFSMDDRLRHVEHLLEAAQTHAPGWVQP